jgi:exodeoxyribonuclease V alpha subunit
MNGETGIVTNIDPVEVAWGPEGRSTPVKDEYRADIQPAWAITGHRSQGSEATRVVIALDSKALLTRQWLYTAITRATEQSVLVGPCAVLEAAVSRVSQRVTGFRLTDIGASSSGT